MGRLIAVAMAGMLMAAASANASTSDQVIDYNYTEGGLIQVLDNQVDKIVLSLDLNSVKRSKNQVLGGEYGEEYISSIVKIDFLEGSPLKDPADLDHIAQQWVISCADNSYYKLASSSYGPNGKFIGSTGLGNDIPLKSDFTIPTDDNEVERATRLATTLACSHYDVISAKPDYFKHTR